MSFTPIIYLWAVTGIAAMAYALWGLASGASSEWTLSALTGGIACIAAGLYQAWWEENVFDDDPADLRPRDDIDHHGVEA